MKGKMLRKLCTKILATSWRYKMDITFRLLNKKRSVLRCISSSSVDIRLNKTVEYMYMKRCANLQINFFFNLKVMFLKMFTLQTWLHRGVIKLITLSVKKNLILNKWDKLNFFTVWLIKMTLTLLTWVNLFWCIYQKFLPDCNKLFFKFQGTQSANPHNDYCQHFVDTGQRPHNFIRDVGG